MAKITLSLPEAAAGSLPAICLCCGDSASVLREDNLVWRTRSLKWGLPAVLLTPLAYLLIEQNAALIALWFAAYVVAAYGLIHTKVRVVRVMVPFCARHKYHFYWKRWWENLRHPICALMLLLIFGSSGAILATAGLLDLVTSLLCGLVYFLAYETVLLFIPLVFIHPTDVTDHTVTLGQVSETFTEYLIAQRHRAALEEVPPCAGT